MRVCLRARVSSHLLPVATSTNGDHEFLWSFLILLQVCVKIAPDTFCVPVMPQHFNGYSLILDFQPYKANGKMNKSLRRKSYTDWTGL